MRTNYFWHQALGMSCLISVSVTGATFAGEEPPTSYIIQDLGTFGEPGAGAFANATGINEQGHVAGQAEDENLAVHAFLFRDGELLDLGDLNGDGAGSLAKGVNDLDQVVGQSMAPYPPNPQSSVGHAFLWTEEDGMIDLMEGMTAAGWAWGINNDTQVALSIGGPDGGPHVWDEENGLQLIGFDDVPDGFGGDAWEINNNGIVCGNQWRSDFEVHAFTYDTNAETVTDLHDSSIMRTSQAYGLNDNGDVAGWFEKLNLRNVPALWPADGSGPVELPLDLRPDLLEGSAEHVNDLGDIVGKDNSVDSGVPNEAWVIFNAVGTDPKNMNKIALEDLIPTEDAAEWELTLAFEINDNRQITGIGLHNYLTRAFLMTPVVDGDLNVDGMVNVADLLQLLGAWGECPQDGACPADLDGNGSVGVADLLELLANWG